MIVRFCAFITSTAHILFAHMHLVVLILDKLSLSLTAKSTAVRRPLLKYQLIGHVFATGNIWLWLVDFMSSIRMLYKHDTMLSQCYGTTRWHCQTIAPELGCYAFETRVSADGYRNPSPHPKWKGKSLRVCLCARVFVFKWKKLKAGSLDKSGTTTCAVSIPPATKAWGATVCFLLFSVWQRIILLSKYIVPILKF